MLNSTPVHFRKSMRNQRGSIIVFVLVFVVLLTFVVTAFLEEATGRIKYYGLFHNRDDLRVDAYSALEIALAVVNQYRDAEGALWGPAQGWGNPFATFPFTPAHAADVSVTFEDESAKFPLHSADYNLLLALFTQLGFPLNEAESLADGFLDWVDEDDLRRLNGFDGDDYRSFNPPYRPANAPVQSWDEFRLIEPFRSLFWDEDGIPAPEWEAFRSVVSLVYKGPININGAPPLIREMLYEQGLLDNYAFEDFLNGADGEQGTEDDRLVRNNDRGYIRGEDNRNLATEVQLLRVRVVASRGEARFQLEGLVIWSGSDPAAGRSRAVEDNPETPIDPSNATAEQDREARGGVTTRPAAGSDLGYPFSFVRLVENRNF